MSISARRKLRLMARLLLLLACGLLLLPRPAAAQSTPVLLRWGAGQGANGYRIQVRNAEQDVIADSRVATNELRIDLEPGEYEYRLAALDAFEKPGPWSPWYSVKIRRTGTPVLEPGPLPITRDSQATLRINGKNLFAYTRVRILASDGSGELAVSGQSARPGGLEIRVDAANARPGSYDLILENPNGKSLRAPGYLLVQRGALPLEILVPGLPQVLRGETSKGVAWMTAFAWLGAGGIAEWAAAERIVVSKESDPLFLSFNDPLVYLLFGRETFGGTDTGTLLGGLVYLRGSERTRAYDTHQQNQRALGGLAALLYVGHLVDALFFAPAPGEAKKMAAAPALNFYVQPELIESGTAAQPGLAAGMSIDFSF